jgi:hypothetical protein
MDQLEEKRMQPTKQKAIYVVTVLTLILLTINGCAVLTESQVKEIGKFAKASEGYSELPGTLTKSYGELLRSSDLLNIARKEFGQISKDGGIDTSAANDAWDSIQDAYKDETEFEAAGKRMDAALSVLKEYSGLLTSLVSGDSTEALSGSAKAFGKSLDEATEAYNKKYRADNPLGKVGGAVAMAVRSAGGLYIRAKQASILKETLKDADPLIAGLMDEVKLIASEKIKPSLQNYEKNFLQKNFKSLANNKKKLDISSVSIVYNSLYKTRQTIILAEKVANAAEIYKKAHAELVENTRVKMTLKEAISQVQSLAAEVSAGNKVKDEVNK